MVVIVRMEILTVNVFFWMWWDENCFMNNVQGIMSNRLSKKQVMIISTNKIFQCFSQSDNDINKRSLINFKST